MNYSNTNRGKIWPNEQKEKEFQPDFKGSLNVRGEEFRISGWKRSEGMNPKAPSFSFSVQPKSEKTTEQPKDYVVETGNR